MNDHVAAEAEMKLVSLAGGEWFGIILSVSVDDALVLTARATLLGSAERTNIPHAVEPLLRFVAQLAAESVIAFHV